MSHTLPDHLAIDPSSRFHDEAAINRGVGVRFNGVESDNVEDSVSYTHLDVYKRQVMNSDQLRFDKPMLDDWLRRELRADAALSVR